MYIALAMLYWLMTMFYKCSSLKTFRDILSQMNIHTATIAISNYIFLYSVYNPYIEMSNGIKQQSLGYSYKFPHILKNYKKDSLVKNKIKQIA